MALCEGARERGSEGASEEVESEDERLSTPKKLRKSEGGGEVNTKQLSDPKEEGDCSQ